MRKMLFLMALLLLPSIAFGGDLKPLTIDGCSVFPDGTLAHRSLWADCCIKHDIAYWQGGTCDDRLNADNALKQCVSKVGNPKIAKIMLAGVRVGGSPYLPTKFRWGYGWPYLRGYMQLTEEEKLEVKNELVSLKILLKSILEELEP